MTLPTRVGSPILHARDEYIAFRNGAATVYLSLPFARTTRHVGLAEMAPSMASSALLVDQVPRASFFYRSFSYHQVWSRPGRKAAGAAHKVVGRVATSIKIMYNTLYIVLGSTWCAFKTGIRLQQFLMAIRMIASTVTVEFCHIADLYLGQDFTRLGIISPRC